MTTRDYFDHTQITNKSQVTTLAEEVLLAKREALHQENVRRRRVRKSIKNKALSVAGSKHDRRRIQKGATANELLKNPSTLNKKTRKTRREESRNLSKLSKKFSTERTNNV